MSPQVLDPAASSNQAKLSDTESRDDNNATSQHTGKSERSKHRESKRSSSHKESRGHRHHRSRHDPAQITNEERLGRGDKEILKRQISDIVVKQLSKFKTKLRGSKFKDLARSLTKVLFDKEMRSTNNKFVDGSLLEASQASIKKWVKDYLARHGFHQPQPSKSSSARASTTATNGISGNNEAAANGNRNDGDGDDDGDGVGLGIDNGDDDLGNSSMDLDSPNDPPTDLDQSRSAKPGHTSSSHDHGGQSLQQHQQSTTAAASNNRTTAAPGKDNSNHGRGNPNHKPDHEDEQSPVIALAIEDDDDRFYQMSD
eukprot:jgi/Hompol1/6589/HPOL_003163-RA